MMDMTGGSLMMLLLTLYLTLAALLGVPMLAFNVAGCCRERGGSWPHERWRRRGHLGLRYILFGITPPPG